MEHRVINAKLNGMDVIQDQYSGQLVRLTLEPEVIRRSNYIERRHAAGQGEANNESLVGIS